MKSKALTMAVVSVAVGVGTYLGLKLLMPQGTEGPAEVASVTEEQVFGGSLAPAPIDDAAATEIPAAGDTASDATSDTAAAPAEATDPSMDLAAAPTEAPVETPVEPEPEVTPPPAEVAPEPVAEPEPAPAPAPAPKAKPKPKASAPAAVAPSWWLPEAPKAQLSIVYAGSMSGQKAIAVLFNGAFDDAKLANQTIGVSDTSGARVSGQWSVSPNNKRMLIFPVSKAGSYRVSATPKLADRAGRKLGRVQAGAVIVK